jgi:predicted nucleic acid-binding protein
MPAEAARQFLDTNVIAYAHDTAAAQKRARATALLVELAENEKAAVSIQVLQELFVTLTGPRFSDPMPAAAAAAVVADVSAYSVHVPQRADVLAAIEMHQRHGLSFWDAMILRSANQMGCELLWSEDMSSGRRYDGVEVRNPFV